MNRYFQITIALPVVLVSLLVTGCGQSMGLQASRLVATKAEGFVQPEFNSYINQFIKQGAFHGKAISDEGLTVVFANLQNVALLGTCTPSTITIRINTETWDSLSAVQREILLFHELGHCLLGRPHDNNTLENGIKPESIMHATLLDEHLYTLFYNDYLNELFKG